MADFYMIGNNLSVDFANSVKSVAGESDPLEGWDGLVRFLAAARMIGRSRQEALLELSHSAPKEVAGTYSLALELRTVIRQCLAARIDGVGIRPEWIEPINRILRLTEGYDQLVFEEGGETGERWSIEFVVRERRLEWLLASIARSAAELIAEGPEAPIRKCANPECILYFYDDSRRGDRRWCSMAACGNRSKVAAHARRGRQSGGKLRSYKTKRPRKG